MRLNPAIAEQPERVDEVLPRLRAAILSVAERRARRGEQRDDRLAARQRDASASSAPTTFVPVRLIDFDHPRANTLVVSTEVTYPPGHRGAAVRPRPVGQRLPARRRRDEDAGQHARPHGSTRADDIHDGYEVKTPGFFVPNVLSFATEGKEFRYGAVRQPAEMWLPWSRTTDELLAAGLASVLRSVELLLRPEMLLDILRTYTLFSRRSSTARRLHDEDHPPLPAGRGGGGDRRPGPRPGRSARGSSGTTGSGKTLLMAFAAAKLRQQPTSTRRRSSSSSTGST